MNDIITYRPYGSHARSLPFTVPVGMLAFMAAGYCLPFWGFESFILVAIGIACTWLTKVLYDSANTVVFFEKEGIRIAGGRYNNYRYIAWGELQYAYYVRNLKGHLFLVLSPRKLNQKEAKAFANQGGNSFKIYINYTIIMHIDFSSNASNVKEAIKKNISFIDIY